MVDCDVLMPELEGHEEGIYVVLGRTTICDLRV
jgi:hypothetical protein